MLLGEDEILGQVRDAYKIALDQGATGPVLNRIFQGALEVGKRVRSETEIGRRPVSVAFAGSKTCRAHLRKAQYPSKGVDRGSGGATSEQVMRHSTAIAEFASCACSIGPPSSTAVDPRAARFGGEVVPWENLSAALEWPDLIVTSVSSAEPILTRAMIERAMTARGNRRRVWYLLIIDLGVPRNVASDAADVYNTYLYNIDDLTEIVEQNKKARVAEIPRAEAIIEEQIEKFLHWQAGVATGAVLGDLKVKLSAEREAFLRERLAAMPQLSEQDRAQFAELLKDFLDRVWFSTWRNACGASRICAASFRTSKRCETCFALTGRSLESAENCWNPGQRASLSGRPRASPKPCARTADVETELVIIKTSGDKFQQTSFSQFGTKGVFIKELEDALLERRIDLAVHSMKDVPTEIPDGLTIAAVCKRHDVRDALLSNSGASLGRTPSGARVGTSSMRHGGRSCCMREAICGCSNSAATSTLGSKKLNCIRRITTPSCSPRQALDRLGFKLEHHQVLPPDVCLPAAGAGNWWGSSRGWRMATRCASWRN